jgi:diguanylate cyclase (GGDEF)-like protein
MSVDDDDDVENTRVGARPVIPTAIAQTAKSQRPWLVIVSGIHSIGKMYRLEHEVLLGRSAEADVQIDEDGVSRRHAMLTRSDDGRVEIVDLKSRNGTFVNGEPISRSALSDGDKIQIGDTTILKLSYQDELDEQLSRNLYESATRDPLTHAVNKRGFGEQLAKEYAFAVRHGQALSLLALDVDHFKRVNDTYGHAAGDYVLKHLAEVIGVAIRREDLLARIGGEEFAVLLRDIARQGALDCGERIRASIEKTLFETGGKRIPITISVGVATLQRDVHATPEALLEAADRALYQAKHTGRNRVCAADSTAG